MKYYQYLIKAKHGARFGLTQRVKEINEAVQGTGMGLYFNSDPEPVKTEALLEVTRLMAAMPIIIRDQFHLVLIEGDFEP